MRWLADLDTYDWPFSARTSSRNHIGGSVRLTPSTPNIPGDGASLYPPNNRLYRGRMIVITNWSTS